MSSSLLAIGTRFGLSEAGFLSLLLTIAFCCMVFAVAALLRQSYKDQKLEVQRVRRKLRSKFDH
ncbi:MAG: hypothetical protein NXI17_11980 [Alphaproteobacteria bacterium]|nr:hypothetical protein [Alphaproteobacteria bacterium]